MAGTRQALAELMAWSGIEEQGEAITLMIHRLHELSREEAMKMLTPPRHKIELNGNVARRQDQFRIGRELRTPSLMLGDDPDDTEIYVIE